MTDDKTIPMTLAELRAVVRKCRAVGCDRLETKQSGVCDLHNDNPRVSDNIDAPTIRAVQARIDGLSAQDDAWGIARFVSAHGLVSSVRGPYAFASKKDAERYAETHLEKGTYTVVKL